MAAWLGVPTPNFSHAAFWLCVLGLLAVQPPFTARHLDGAHTKNSPYRDGLPRRGTGPAGPAQGPAGRVNGPPTRRPLPCPEAQSSLPGRGKQGSGRRTAPAPRGARSGCSVRRAPAASRWRHPRHSHRSAAATVAARCTLGLRMRQAKPQRPARAPAQVVQGVTGRAVEARPQAAPAACWTTRALTRVRARGRRASRY